MGRSQFSPTMVQTICGPSGTHTREVQATPEFRIERLEAALREALRRIERLERRTVVLPKGIRPPRRGYGS
jgi:hypothetical protein